jgi:serine protease Do
MNNLHNPRLNRPYARYAIPTPLAVALLALASLASPALLTAQTSPKTPAQTHVPGAPPANTRAADPHAADALHQLNDSIEALVERISPSVVQIQVTGYGAAQDSSQGQTSVVIGKQRSIGSGVIVDSEGYIVTNAHVVNGAEKVEVIVPPQLTVNPSAGTSPDMRERSYEGRIVGVTKEIDLAVIKIEAHGLPAIAIGNSVPSRQGEMVLAFGSPEGLRNTVTMGVVSSVARQPDPDSPLVYVQTDTPINPGNSGGPLVDADGNLVGINTFILSSSGGNQGLGFAIPAAEVAYAYPQLLKYGHIHQPEIGAIAQTITPELAAGLHLQRDFGVIVADVVPGGSAEAGGLKIQDIVLSVDGTRIGSLPLFTSALYMHKSGETAKFEVLRGSDRLQLDIRLMARPHKTDSLADLADPEKNLVQPLGILGIALKPDIVASLPDLRIQTGVIVAARTLGTETQEIPLQTGDVIHALNGVTITDLDGLRAELAKLKAGDAVVLQLERYTQLIYVSFVI